MKNDIGKITEGKEKEREGCGNSGMKKIGGIFCSTRCCWWKSTGALHRLFSCRRYRKLLFLGSREGSFC